MRNLYLIPIVLTSVWLLMPSTLFSQGSRLELIHADLSRGLKSGGEEVQILEGNVHVRQDTVDIYCDTATYYPAESRLELSGNVRILRNQETMTAETVTYLSRRKLAIARKNVHVWEPGRALFSEYLEYYYDSERAFARTNVRLIDESSRTTVLSQKGDYRPIENRCFVEDDAHLIQVDSTGTDTLHIRGKYLEYYFAPRSEAVARENVTIERQGLVATCDSAIYYIDKEQADLSVDPEAKQEANLLKGNRISLFFEEMKIQRIKVTGDALATSVADSVEGKINKLSGKQILAFVKGSDVEEMRASDNARSIYYIEDDGSGQGINTASADTIRIFFKEGELSRIGVQGGSQGIYYPQNYDGEVETEY
ncbi:MAG: OstA-like protein [Calditrichota bacterium]